MISNKEISELPPQSAKAVPKQEEAVDINMVALSVKDVTEPSTKNDTGKKALKNLARSEIRRQESATNLVVPISWNNRKSSAHFRANRRYGCGCGRSYDGCYIRLGY